MAPPDPQLAPHGLKKFPRVFDEPLGRQTLHLGIWRHAMLGKWCTSRVLGPQGVQRGVRGVRWGQKIKYGSKCLKLPNSSRKVVFSILKISGQNEKYLEKFPNVKIFLSILQISWKNFKIEKITFLDELGNFKHFEPYFIFYPHMTPLGPL